MHAEQLIDRYLEEGSLRAAKPRPGFKPKPTTKTVKGKVLSGNDVVGLKSKQEVFISGKRSRVLEVEVRGDEVTVYYVPGVKSYGAEKNLIVSRKDATTPIQYATTLEYEGVDEDPGSFKRLAAQYGGKLVKSSATYAEYFFKDYEDRDDPEAPSNWNADMFSQSLFRKRVGSTIEPTKGGWLVKVGV